MSHKTLAGQLVNLQRENPLARAVNQNKTVWDVGLRLNCGTIVCLRTHLPTGFPDRAAPHMEIVLPTNIRSRAQHPWLDAQMRVVGMVELSQWGRSRNHLIGPLLKKATSHFIGFPPVLVPFNAPAPAYGFGGRPRPRPAVHGRPAPHYPQRAPAYGFGGCRPRPRPAVHGRPAPHYPQHQQRPPPYNPAYPPVRHARQPPAAAKPKPKPPPRLQLLEISNMSKPLVNLIRTELKNSEGDSIVIPDLMRWGLREISKKRTQHLELVGQNAKLAANNLKLSGEQEALKAQLHTLRDQARAKHSEYAKVKQELLDIQKTMTPAYAVETVVESVEQLDSQCSEMADDFVFDDMELKDFEDAFLKARTLYHKRNALLEVQKENYA